MATRKNEQIAALCGSFIPADVVQRVRTDGRHDTAGIARALGVPVATYLSAVAATDPVPERPINWSATPGVGVAPFCLPAFVGVATIAYAHPWYPGYTFGAPVFNNV